MPSKVSSILVQRDQLWRGLATSSEFSSWPATQEELIDPLEFASIRFGENLDSGIFECGWQRGTGRTTRMLLTALDEALTGSKVLIIFPHLTTPGIWQGFIEDALKRTHLDRYTVKAGHIRSYDFRPTGGVLTLARITQLGQLSRGFDSIHVDNCILDFYENHRQSLGFASMLFRQNLPKTAGILDWSGHMWRAGDAFRFRVHPWQAGLITEIGRIGRIVTHFSVLFMGEWSVLPPGASDTLGVLDR